MTIPLDSFRASQIITNPLKFEKMKKVLSIFAIALFSIGLFSCEADNTAEDQALYEQGTGGDDTPTSGRGG